MTEKKSSDLYDSKRKALLLQIQQLSQIPGQEEMVTKLREALSRLELAHEESRIVELVENNADYYVDPAEPLEEIHLRDQNGERFIRIGETYIPVVQQSLEKAKWQAVAGPVYVEGGRKWSKVLFEKQNKYGWNETLRPGEEIPFGQRKGERLESIDNILEGPAEVRVFNGVLSHVAQLEKEYYSLNPDLEEYDALTTQINMQFRRLLGIETDLEEQLDALRLSLPEKLVQQVDRLDDPEGFALRVSEILRMGSFLTELDDREVSHIPRVDPRFKLTPYIQERFERFAQLINRQLGLGNNYLLDQLVINNQTPSWETLQAKGMAVIVGPRGTGKNKLVDHYCSASNRPLFRYACSPDKRESDLTYDVQLKDGEVVRVPSRILIAVTTPNAMLELDEVNLLDPAVAKFFNSLLDHDRAIFLNDQIIQSAPGVVIAGLMNPAEYQGVHDLPETIDDRSNMMRMDYPPLKVVYEGRDHFTYDEALILKEHIHPLAEFSDEEFVQLWEHVVNNRSGFISYDPEIIKIVQDLKKIIMIADRTRSIVHKNKTRVGNIRMERDISLRGSIDAARTYSEQHLWDRSNIKLREGYSSYWGAAEYAIAETYLPHTDGYKRGLEDKTALLNVLNEQTSI